MKLKVISLCISAAGVLFTACEKNDPPLDTSRTVVQVKDLPADPATGRDPVTGQPVGVKNQFTLFSLKDSSVVDHKDSATTKWDIGFRADIIIVNGGKSGPGNGAAYIWDGLFGELKEAGHDSLFIQDNPPAYAIGQKWRSTSTDPATMARIIKPIPGKILVVRTADNKYAKIEMLSYYKGSPASPNPFTDKDRHLSFRYVYQSSGKKFF